MTLASQLSGSQAATIKTLMQRIDSMQFSMAGTTTMAPPVDGLGNIDIAYIPETGGVYSRSAYPILFEKAKKMNWIVDDSVWLATRALSPDGAVQKYSYGDGSTTFRVPTVGITGGFARLVGENGTAPLGDLFQGFQDQIQNITGTFGSASAILNAGSYDGVFEATRNTGNEPVYDNPGETTDYTHINFDASRVARTGDETSPKGFYKVPWIYTGNDVTSIPTPEPAWLSQQTQNTQDIAELQATEAQRGKTILCDDVKVIAGNSVTLSQPMTNFDALIVYCSATYNGVDEQSTSSLIEPSALSDTNFTVQVFGGYAANGNDWFCYTVPSNNTSTSIFVNGGNVGLYNNIGVYKVVGIKY